MKLSPSSLWLPLATSHVSDDATTAATAPLETFWFLPQQITVGCTVSDRFEGHTKDLWRLLENTRKPSLCSNFWQSIRQPASINLDLKTRRNTQTYWRRHVKTPQCNSKNPRTMYSGHVVSTREHDVAIFTNGEWSALYTGEQRHALSRGVPRGVWIAQRWNAHLAPQLIERRIRHWREGCGPSKLFVPKLLISFGERT